jgi:tetratricopeptide (TPR) repeat protein
VNVRRLGLLAPPAAALLVTMAIEARATTEDAVASAERTLAYVAQNQGSVQAAIDIARNEQRTPEGKLANGELLFRLRDYDRAAVLLSEIVEEFPDTPSYPDALWLRGETYFGMKDYLAARRDYKVLVDRASDPRFQVYAGRALCRLLNLAVRLEDPPDAIAVLLGKFDQIPPGQVDASLLYAKGKAHYREGLWGDAARSFGGVPTDAPDGPQARYFQGLVAIQIARAAQPGAASNHVDYRPAIEAFRVAAGLPSDTPEHRQVVDLSWMAIGRLFYEMEQYQAATHAYAKVGRDSPVFDTMLYELAWVYVRLGDVDRAEHALEILMTSDPNSEYVADGTLLRADLLLRVGAFDRALQMYQSIRDQYDPMRAKVDAFLGATNDLSAYYDRLALQELDAVDHGDSLPPLAVRWARDAQDGALAFAVIDDVGESKSIIAKSTELADRLSALSEASTRVRAFPELEAGERSALGLVNRLSRERLVLANALDDLEPAELTGAIGEIRRQRRALADAIRQLPITDQDFTVRDEQGMTQWNGVSQILTRRSMEVDALQATVNGLRRTMGDGTQQGVVRDPVSTQRLQAELDANRKDLNRYRDDIADLRRAIDLGRAQIGLGDSRYQNDTVARDEFAALVDQEVQSASTGAAGADAARFALTAVPLLARFRQEELRLASSIAAIESQVAARSLTLRSKVDAERANLAADQQQLEAVDNDGHDLVGRIAQRNFTFARDRLRGVVLRADVGITEEAWEVREEELSRVRSLQSDRARQEQLLDEELKEVRDDGVEPAQPSN